MCLYNQWSHLWINDWLYFPSIDHTLIIAYRYKLMLVDSGFIIIIAHAHRPSLHYSITAVCYRFIDFCLQLFCCIYSSVLLDLERIKVRIILISTWVMYIMYTIYYMRRVYQVLLLFKYSHCLSLAVHPVGKYTSHTSKYGSYVI